MNKVVGLIVAIVVVAGGWYFYSQSQTKEADTQNMGSYAYLCENGSTFSMIPSDDASAVTLTAGSQGMFTGDVELHKMGDGPHYENVSSDPLIVFSGAGEEVQLTVGNESTVCNPLPNSEMAPWNWGDTGEGGGVKPDVALVVRESIVGKWQSTEDAKFTREFRDGGVVIDWYDNETKSEGSWKVFTKENPVQVAFPLESDAVYIQMTMSGTQAEKLNFKLSTLTPDILELTYMDRGGVLQFRSVK